MVSQLVNMLPIELLLLLLAFHYLADYQLTNGWMQRAKADGRQLLPILAHSSVHTLLMGGLLMLSTPLVAFVGIALELSTHFVIDVAKGRITAAYPIFADTKQKPHWQLYGLD